MTLLRAVPLALGILLCGCLEHQVQTTVYLDGSCDRMVMLPADSMVVPSTPFPLNVAAGWDTSWRPAKGGKGFVLVLTKHFARPEELAAEYGAPADSSGLHVEVEVERSFRWFYTYFRYREVFHRLSPFTKVPPTAVLTAEEVSMYAHGERNSLLNQKAEIWVARSLYEILIDTLTAGLLAGGDRPGVAILEEKKELLFEAMVKIGPDSTLRDFGDVIAERISYRGDARSFFVGSKITQAGLTAFVELVGMVAGIPPTPILEESARSAWRAWNNVVERSARMQGIFVVSATLPGLVVQTNSPIADAQTLTWKFDGEQYSMTDYVMEAESRVENLWAFGVTVTVALVLGGIILYGRRRT
jgi:hypothetical protein